LNNIIHKPLNEISDKRRQKEQSLKLPRTTSRRLSLVERSWGDYGN